MRLANYSLRFMAGSLKAWMRPSCKTPRSYSISLAAMSRLLRDQGKRVEVLSTAVLLRASTRDLMEAKALLDEPAA
jgi:hypothetical protein